MCIILCTFLFSILAFLLLKNNEKVAVFGVYTRENKWFYLKYFLFRGVLGVRWLLRKVRVMFGVEKDRYTKGVALETPQSMGNHIKAFDAVFFIGAGEDYWFTIGAERRKHDIINGVFYLVVPNIGLLCSSSLPDTILFNSGRDGWKSETINIEPVVPFKNWKLSYIGTMWSKQDPSKIYNVKFQADWSSEWDYFDYGTDLHPATVARSVAKESWTKQHFQNLKKHHQSRYEQMGQAQMTIDVDGQKFEAAIPSFRDHGYGNVRDWSLMHRYAFFHIFLKDGRSAAVGVVSQPCTCTTIETGFLSEADGTLHPIEWCNLELYQHGEQGTPPTDHAFQFKAGNEVYTCQVTVKHQSTHYVGWDWEAKMIERFVDYDVNGAKGHGVSEFHYRHTNGRPEYLNNDDPPWFHFVRQKYVNDIS